MTDVGRKLISLFVDRSCQQWVVRDREGNFWILPHGDDAWDHREAFCPTAETDLEPVPGHYRDLLGIPS